MEEVRKFVQNLWNEALNSVIPCITSGDRETMEFYYGMSEACRRIMDKLKEVSK